MNALTALQNKFGSERVEADNSVPCIWVSLMEEETAEDVALAMGLSDDDLVYTDYGSQLASGVHCLTNVYKNGINVQIGMKIEEGYFCSALVRHSRHDGVLLFGESNEEAEQSPSFDDSFDSAEYAPDFSEFPSDDEPAFFLCWQTQDGFVGRGQATGTYQDVLEAVAQANEDTPQFKHWVGCGRFEPSEHNCGFVQLPDVFGFLICPF